tara:strand:+ start:3760 stop:4863 length:1104 start_codon:yes stop_codon:yes gene_type:complete
MKYLITEFTGLGNFIQKTPMIRSITRLDKNYEISLIGHNKWGGLDTIKNSRIINDFYVVSDKNDASETISWIDKHNFDVILDPPGSFTPYQIFECFLKSNAEKIIKWKEMIPLVFESPREIICNYTLKDIFRNYYKFLKSILKTKYISIKENTHEIDANYDSLEKFLGKSIDRDYKTFIYFLKDPRVTAKYNLLSNKYICVQPSAANGSPTIKTWNPENFIKLINDFESLYPEYKFVIIGDKGDNDNVIKKYVWPSNVLNLAGKTNINELLNIMNESSCVICHDSGVMHMSNALDIPVIALYGPTNYQWTGPKGKNTRVIFSKNKFFNIMAKSSESEIKLGKKYRNYEAMSEIKVDLVMEKIRGIIR